MLIGDVSILYSYNNSYMGNRLTPPPTADPPSSRDFPTDYLERVKKTHESGGYGSIGWGLEGRGLKSTSVDCFQARAVPSGTTMYVCGLWPKVRNAVFSKQVTSHDQTAFVTAIQVVLLVDRIVYHNYSVSFLLKESLNHWFIPPSPPKCSPANTIHVVLSTLYEHWTSLCPVLCVWSS